MAHKLFTRLVKIIAKLAAIFSLLVPAGAAATPGALTQLPDPFGCHLQQPANGPAPAPCSGSQGLAHPTALALSANGASVYVASKGQTAADGGDAIAAFSRDPGNGALSQLQGTAACVANTGTGDADCAAGKALDDPVGVVVSPGGEHVYVASLESDAVASFSRDGNDGALTQLPGGYGCISQGGVGGCSMAAGLEEPRAIDASPDGKHLYVATTGGNGYVAILRRKLSPRQSPYQAPIGTLSYAGCVTSYGGCGANVKGILDANGVVVSPDGSHVYVTSNVGVSAFSRNAGTGALTQLPGQEGCVVNLYNGNPQVPGCKSGQGMLKHPRAISISPDGETLYVASNGASNSDPAGMVAVLDRDPATGNLTPLGCLQDAGIAPCADAEAFQGPRSVAVSPDGGTAYIPASYGLNHALTLFSRDQGTGQLTQLPGEAGCFTQYPSGCTQVHNMPVPKLVAVSADGLNVYVASTYVNGGGTLASFAHAPLCQSKSVDNQGGSGADIQLECSSPGNQPLTYSIVTPSNLADVTIDQATGIAHYAPKSSFVGQDSFTFRATAGGIDSNVATITVNNLP